MLLGLRHETGAATSARERVDRADRAGSAVNSCLAAAVPQMSESRELPLVVIVGPTASGKSKLAVWLALQVGGEVIACDSTQMYRGFDIGTAKPGAEERQGVPHHMMDLLDPSEEATAGGYRERA